MVKMITPSTGERSLTSLSDRLTSVSSVDHLEHDLAGALRGDPDALDLIRRTRWPGKQRDQRERAQKNGCWQHGAHSG
jgi:hypothetical protein